jgi:hypothetical protein
MEGTMVVVEEDVEKDDAESDFDRQASSGGQLGVRADGEAAEGQRVELAARRQTGRPTDGISREFTAMETRGMTNSWLPITLRATFRNNPGVTRTCGCSFDAS